MTKGASAPQKTSVDTMIEFSKERTLSFASWEALIDKLGLKQKLTSAKTIVLKPNLAAGAKAEPERHICADMAFIRNIAELCRRSNPSARIFVAEGDSTGVGFAYMKFEHFGLPGVVDPEGQTRVETLDLSRDRLKLVEDPRFLYFKDTESLWASERLLDADFVVSLSNLKTHTVTLYTGACKNLFGALPASNKSVYHPYIHQVVHDITLAVQPDLNVVDAFYCMEKNGPVGGIDVDRGFRIFSNDPLEADVYGAKCACIAPSKVKYLTLLAKDLGRPKIDEKLVAEYAFKAKLPDRFVRFSNAVGLWIQRRGTKLAATGHRVHIARTPVLMAIAFAKPLLVKIFGLKKLKRMKEKKNAGKD